MPAAGDGTTAGRAATTVRKAPAGNLDRTFGRGAAGGDELFRTEVMASLQAAVGMNSGTE
jgi:hypothetical protein